MGRISRRKLNSVLEERIYEIFWEHLASLQSSELIQEFLQSLLSHTEQVMLSKRLAIALLLSREHTYQTIDDTLKVSKATIATVHRQLLTGASGYMKAVNSVNQRKKKQALLDDIEELLLKFSIPQKEHTFRHKLKSEIGRGLRKRKYQREIL